MRISVRHTTVYRYDRPVVLEPHVLRLRPREDASQRLMDFQLEVSPRPQGQAQILDEEGNVCEQAWFAGETEELAVRSAFEVETLRGNPFDFLLPPPEALVLPRAGAREASDACVAEFAESVTERAGRQTMPFLDMLAQDLFQGCEHVVRPQGAPQAAAETLRDRRGSCRDLAVLFSAVCRSVGMRARFVSGYERESAFQDHAHMHAWAEVFIPGGGWRGYDPSRGVAVSQGHVPVAAAVDPAMAAPITGSYRGAAGCRMEVEIAMEVG